MTTYFGYWNIHTIKQLKKNSTKQQTHPFCFICRDFPHLLYETRMHCQAKCLFSSFHCPPRSKEVACENVSMFVPQLRFGITGHFVSVTGSDVWSRKKIDFHRLPCTWSNESGKLCVPWANMTGMSLREFIYMQMHRGHIGVIFTKWPYSPGGHF